MKVLVEEIRPAIEDVQMIKKLIEKYHYFYCIPPNILGQYTPHRCYDCGHHYIEEVWRCKCHKCSNPGHGADFNGNLNFEANELCYCHTAFSKYNEADEELIKNEKIHNEQLRKIEEQEEKELRSKLQKCILTYTKGYKI